MNEEQRASQLSAMFDGELPAGECELMARRVARDDALRKQWERYALIGAALRRAAGEPLDLRIASRVRATISAEAGHGDGSAPGSGAMAQRRERPWARPAAGLVAAAAVAAIAVIGLRGRDAALTGVTAPAVVASSDALPTARSAETTVVLGPSTAAEPESYVVPVSREPASFLPPVQLANYVVAHSEVSMPLTRRNLLSALVATEVGEPGEQDASAATAPSIDLVDER